MNIVSDHGLLLLESRTEGIMSYEIYNEHAKWQVVVEKRDYVGMVHQRVSQIIYLLSTFIFHFES